MKTKEVTGEREGQHKKLRVDLGRKEERNITK